MWIPMEEGLQMWFRFDSGSLIPETANHQYAPLGFLSAFEYPLQTLNWYCAGSVDFFKQRLHQRLHLVLVSDLSQCRLQDVQ